MYCTKVHCDKTLEIKVNNIHVLDMASYQTARTYKPRPLDFLQCSCALTNDSLTKKITSLSNACATVIRNVRKNPNGLIRSSSTLEKKYLRTLFLINREL